MFGFTRDPVEKRAFEYDDEYQLGHRGKVRRACPPELSEETRQVLAEAFYSLAEQLERDAGEFRRHGKAIIDAEAFGTMVSGG